MNHNHSFLLHKIIILISTVAYVQTYIDVTLEASVSSADIIYNFPLTIESQHYKVGISLQNQEEYLVAPEVVKHKHKSNKTGLSKK